MTHHADSQWAENISLILSIPSPFTSLDTALFEDFLGISYLQTVMHNLQIRPTEFGFDVRFHRQPRRIRHSFWHRQTYHMSCASCVGNATPECTVI